MLSPSPEMVPAKYYMPPGNAKPPSGVEPPQLDVDAPEPEERSFKSVDAYWRGKGLKTPFSNGLNAAPRSQMAAPAVPSTVCKRKRDREDMAKKRTCTAPAVQAATPPRQRSTPVVGQAVTSHQQPPPKAIVPAAAPPSALVPVAAPPSALVPVVAPPSALVPVAAPPSALVPVAAPPSVLVPVAAPPSALVPVAGSTFSSCSSGGPPPQLLFKRQFPPRLLHG